MELTVIRCPQCSVTCGSGEQTREVTCVDSGGTKTDEISCNNPLRPHTVQRCEMAACPAQMTWHVGDWGLVRTSGMCADFVSEITLHVSPQCSRSCGSGSRSREVICSDRERTLYPMQECSRHPMPSAVERCNTQPCHRPQSEHEWLRATSLTF